MSRSFGKIPDGGWRVFGRGLAQDRAAGSARDRAARAGAASSRGYAFLHHAVDDRSRLAYSEILADEEETTAALWVRARTFFADAGISVHTAMTDNGACYRSHALRTPLART